MLDWPAVNTESVEGGARVDKLNIALKLIQLLNERKSINSKIVAEELHVSIRTAQRYLAELSMLPCVMNLNNNHTYTVNSEYKLSDVFSNGGTTQSRATKTSDHTGLTVIANGSCLLCSNVGTRALNNRVFSAASNLMLINRVAAMLEKRLKLKKRAYSSNKPYSPS